MSGYSYTVIIIIIISSSSSSGITLWRMHCAKSLKVSVSIPDGVITIFHWRNPSGRTVALGWTQPLTEMSTRNISWRVKAVGV